MKATQTLHDLGQSLWLDNITRNLLTAGTLRRCIGELSNEAIAAMPADGGDSEEVLARFAQAGVNADALAARLQDEGAKSFVNSWNELMSVIASKSAVLRKAG